MALSEFEIIRRFFTHRPRHAVLGVGDDAAIVRARRGMDLPVPATWAGGVPALSRLLDEQGGLLALATPAKQPGFLHPSVVLG